MLQKVNICFVFAMICAEKNKDIGRYASYVLVIENGCSSYMTRHGGF